MNDKKHVDELINSISNDQKYNGCVFNTPGIYFVIENGDLWEISDDAGCYPRGGWFPDIISGPTSEENACLQKMMDELGFDEYFFEEIVEEYGEFTDEYALEHFENSNNLDSAKIYFKMKQQIENSKTPFATIKNFASAVCRYGLNNKCLYYKWEGEYIDLYDNIIDTGESRGYYDSMTDADWIYVLENIDDYIVSA